MLESNTYLHNPRCSKSRQGLELLQNEGKEVAVREYLKDVLNKKELTFLLENFSGSKKLLVRKKEKEFSESGLDLNNYDAKSWSEALEKFPKLLERPIYISGQKVLLGRPPEDLLKG